MESTDWSEAPESLSDSHGDRPCWKKNVPKINSRAHPKKRNRWHRHEIPRATHTHKTKQNKTKGKGNVVHHKWPKDNKDSGTVTDRQAGGGGRSVATVLEQEEAVRLAVPRRTGGNIKEKLVKGKRNQN